MQTTSTHGLLPAGPEGSGRGHSPGPGVLKAILAPTPFLSRATARSRARPTSPSHQLSQLRELGGPSPLWAGLASQPAASGGRESWPWLRRLTLGPCESISESRAFYVPLPRAWAGCPAKPGPLSSGIRALTLAPGISRTLCGGPGRSGGPDWAALNMEKGPASIHMWPWSWVNPLRPARPCRAACGGPRANQGSEGS